MSAISYKVDNCTWEAKQPFVNSCCSNHNAFETRAHKKWMFGEQVLGCFFWLNAVHGWQPLQVAEGGVTPSYHDMFQDAAMLRLDTTAWMLQLCMDSQLEQVLNPLFQTLQSHIWTELHVSVLFEIVNDADTALLHQLH